MTSGFNVKEKASVGPFRRKRRAVKNWHAQALMVDPNKTRIITVKTKTVKQIPL